LLSEGDVQEFYNDYLIRASAETIPDSFQWKAIAEISWLDAAGARRTHLLVCELGKYETERLAEIEGLLLARQWIDMRES
jgi:hypothetical protein